MRTLSAIWENSPDTSLTASNLSKYIDTYKSDKLLFIDANDGLLKLRANSKISIKLTQTAALYRFNKSLSTHNSNSYFYPTVRSNVSFRNEGPSDLNSYSVAIESATTNLLSNTGFDSNLTGWTITSSGTSSVAISADYESLFGNVCKITTDTYPHKAGITQIIGTQANSITQINKSFSFYYKSNNILKLKVVGNPTITNYWWNGTSWASAEYIIQIPSSNNVWKRFELKNILCTGLSPVIKAISFEIYSDAIGSTNYLDSVQLETKPFCSSYVSSSRLDSAFNFKKELLNMDHGFIEFETCLKNFNSNYNYLVYATAPITISGSTTDKEVFKLYYDVENKKLIFEIYNKSSGVQGYETLSHTFTYSEFNAIVDRWNRISISWDFTLTTKEMKMYISDGFTVIKEFYFIPTSRQFDYSSNNDITSFGIGGKFGSSSTLISESLFKNLKLNITSKSTQQITYDLSYEIYADKDMFGIFEVSNEDIFIRDYFSSSLIISASKQYYIWLVTELNSDSASIVISESNVYPVSTYNFYSRLIASFMTDSSSNILENTLIDLTELNKKNIMTIESTLPTLAGYTGEVRLLSNVSEKVLIIYSGTGWIRV